MDRFVIISGCSGGGKSTLLEELRRRGYAVVDEPGRRIVARELEGGGLALPWVDGVAFARQTLELSLADRAVAERWPGWVFFDRGLIDAASLESRHSLTIVWVPARSKSELLVNEALLLPIRPFFP